MTFHVFSDMNDRDELGRIRLGRTPKVFDQGDTPVIPRDGLNVLAYDNSITVPGVLRLHSDRLSWCVDANWEALVHVD